MKQTSDEIIFASNNEFTDWFKQYSDCPQFWDYNEPKVYEKVNILSALMMDEIKVKRAKIKTEYQYFDEDCNGHLPLKKMYIDFEGIVEHIT